MGITTGRVAWNAHPCGEVWLEAAQDFALLPASGGAGGGAALRISLLKAQQRGGAGGGAQQHPQGRSPLRLNRNNTPE
jgi:hypothetical protein